MTFVSDASTVCNPELVAALLAEDPVAVAAELAAATLLIPASRLGDGQAVVRSGRTGTGATLLWAFTDLDALAAWDRRPAEHAVVLDWPALCGPDPARDAVVALNAAGPGAFLVDGHAPQPAGNGRVRPAGANDLVGVDARRPVRALASEAHDLGRRAASAGDLEGACAQLERSVEFCGRLGDRLHGAAAALELARARDRAGSVDLALTTWKRAAETLTMLGEEDLAIGALLDAADAALAGGAPADAERLSASALELCAGEEVGDRLLSLWGRLCETW